MEIGFGNGKHFPYYFEQNPDITVTGVDFSRDMCDAARQNNAVFTKNERLLIHCADSASMPLEDNSFDVAVGLNTIFFWNPPGPHFREIRRVLRPEGRLLIGYRPRSSIEKMPFDKQNFTLYDPEELRNLVESNGFRVVDEQFSTFQVKLDEEDEKKMKITDACVIAEKTV